MEDDVKNASAPADTVKAKTIHVTVQAGAAREFPISVFPDSFVEYSFHTKGGDIGFGILLETPDNKLKTVLERERVNAHEEALNGKIRCTQNGTLWFMWDNSHSWFTAKELVYSVTRQPNSTKDEEEADKEEVPPPPPREDPLSEPTAQIQPLENGVAKAANSKPLKVILGTMTMASQVDLKQSINMLRAFVQLDVHSKGLSELDTARMYNKGQTELLLGKVLSDHADLRTALSIASKANPFKGFNENLRPENVKKQLNDTLSALRRPSVDLFYLHAPDHLTNIEDTLKAVNDLYQEGKFRLFGLSNYAAWEVMEIWHICNQNDWIKPTVYQGMYNAITREVEQELLPCLRRLGMKFYAYNPLAGGLLSGRYTSQQTNTTMLLKNKPVDGRFGLKTTKRMYGERYWKREYLDSVFLVQHLCTQHDITLCEASLRWMVWHSKLNCKNNDGIIIGASKMEHLKQNMQALNLDSTQGPLPQSIVDAFDKAWLVCKGSCPKYNR